MKFSSIFFFIIFSVLIVFPIANGQTSVEVSKQKSIEVNINHLGDVHVTHEIKPLDSATEIKLLEGEKSNLTVKNIDGNDIDHDSLGKNESLMIFPSDEFVFIEYDLSDELRLIDNVWTWDFLYLEPTIFIFPEQVDLVFVNDRPAYLGEAVGITCHGCQMVLEYSLNEPILLEDIKIENYEFLIETRTWAKISQLNFDPVSEKINFEVLEGNRFVTTTIPMNLLSEPFQVFLEEEKIFFNEFLNNGTHVWINFRPPNSGEISITGTISPEITEILESQQNEFSYEFVAVGLIIIGIVIVGIIFFKRKK